MKYQVVWTREAENELSTLWLDAKDRSLVTKAADDIDRTLEQEGCFAGESRFGTLRILIHSPLACYFRYLELTQTVFVLEVWHC